MADDRRFLLGLSNNPGCLLDGQGLGITRHDVQNKKTLSRAQDANKSSLNHPIKSLKVAQRYEKNPIQHLASNQWLTLAVAAEPAPRNRSEVAA